MFYPKSHEKEERLLVTRAWNISTSIRFRAEDAPISGIRQLFITRRNALQIQK